MSTVVSLICLGPSFQKMTHHFLLHGSLLLPTNLEKNLKPWRFLEPITLCSSNGSDRLVQICRLTSLPCLHKQSLDEDEDWDQNVMSSPAGYVSMSANSSFASGDFCRLLITFADSLDPDQQNVGPDLDPNCLTIKYFFENKRMI